jgi:site-specific recombinase XerD
MQATVRLCPLFYKGQESIAIQCILSRELETIIRQIKGIKWSQSHRCWYLPFTPTAQKLVKESLEEIAVLDDTMLIQYCKKKEQVIKTRLASFSSGAGIKPNRNITRSADWKLCSENIAALQRFIEQLKLKAYSASTLKTYRNEFLQLLQLLKNKPVDTLTTDDLRRYFVYCFEKLHLSENTLHSRINAIKFYFEQVLGRERFFWEIPRPKKPGTLPKILSQAEVAALLNSVKNIKHKAMLMLAYSGGLRVSEVVSLKTIDIDSDRMIIFLQRSKGKKDRIIPLSPVLLVMLREYAKEYKPDKKGYLFEGRHKGSPYCSRSLQEVLQEAKRKAGVLKPGSIHLLRHSFATHLIERGTDITMIQKLLGHNSIKTTLRYLHTSNKNILKIVSPLDDLKLL